MVFIAGFVCWNIKRPPVLSKPAVANRLSPKRTHPGFQSRNHHVCHCFYRPKIAHLVLPASIFAPKHVWIKYYADLEEWFWFQLQTERNENRRYKSKSKTQTGFKFDHGNNNVIATRNKQKNFIERRSSSINDIEASINVSSRFTTKRYDYSLVIS